MHSAANRLFRPIRLTTTISAMPIFLTSSTSGCVARLRSVFPSLFATVAVRKAEELVATPYRHGSKEKAEAFFLGRHDASYAQSRRTGAPGFPGHYLLRI